MKITSILLLTALSANAAVIVTTGSGTAVQTATHTATFDSIVNGTDLTAYSEGGLSITVPDFAYNPPGGGGPNFVGGFHYPDGGVFAFTRLSVLDGSEILGVEFHVGSGISSPVNIRWQVRSAGSITESGTFAVTTNSAVGFSDLSGFDVLEIGAYSSIADAQAADATSSNRENALLIDNVRVAVPEPTSVCLLLAGAAVLIRRRPRY